MAAHDMRLHLAAFVSLNVCLGTGISVLYYGMLQNTPPQPLRFEDDLEIPVAERKTVATLLADDCRWPFGDPTKSDFHFCGRPHADGSPYCAFHMRRAFQATRPRGPVLKLEIG